jgi:hypothetical protein
MWIVPFLLILVGVIGYVWWAMSDDEKHIY